MKYLLLTSMLFLSGCLSFVRTQATPMCVNKDVKLLGPVSATLEEYFFIAPFAVDSKAAHVGDEWPSLKNITADALSGISGTSKTRFIANPYIQERVDVFLFFPLFYRRSIEISGIAAEMRP